MFGLIPLPYRMLAVALIYFGSVASAFFYGHHTGYASATDQAAKAALKAAQQYQAAYQSATRRADGIAAKLASAESKIIYRTQEVIKYVPKVTTGRACLGAAAVSLLNTRADDAAVPQTPSQPAANDASAPSATDTDVAYWIANANSQYDTCASRLNALIEVVR